VSDLGTAVAKGNLMLLNGDHGRMALQVFWPSAGVLSHNFLRSFFILKST